MAKRTPFEGKMRMVKKRCSTRQMQFKYKEDAKAYAKACGGRVAKQHSMIYGAPSTYYLVTKKRRRKR